MNIDVIYVACYKHDIRFTRALIASIRTWYPNRPISLIKDPSHGDFDTREIESLWNVSVLATNDRKFGWGVSKLEPLFLKHRHRFLVLDSDIVFAGPILELVEQYDDDFIVQFEEPTDSFVDTAYFDLEKLKTYDAGFVFPGHTFNTGQWVGTSGIFAREDFDGFIDWTNPPAVRRPDIFKYGEQGLLNYFLMKHAAAGLKLKRLRFMEVGNNPATLDISVQKLNAESPYQFLIHWCGLKKHRVNDMVRGDIIRHFERKYYDRVPFGGLIAKLRILGNWSLESLRRTARSLKLRD